MEMIEGQTRIYRIDKKFNAYVSHLAEPVDEVVTS